MKKRTIPFNKPYIGEDEANAASDAVRAMNIVGNGLLGQQSEALMRKLFNTEHALLTTSCTHALELSLLSIGLSAGDEVICPSFTFVSTANAIVRQKAKPVFADIDGKTLNIDLNDIEDRVNSRTKAIIPVHYAGLACDMDGIMGLAKRKGIVVIEDAAHGIGAKYKKRFLGTIGDMGCFSFHATKNVTSGEGGALLTSNDIYNRNAEIAREKGTNRAAYLKGQVDKYSWISEGSSYILSDISAAILIKQLNKLDDITRRRKRIFTRYSRGLKGLRDGGVISFPDVPPECDINGHIFYFMVRDEDSRDRCIKELRSRGIEATFHFIPLHTSPFGQKCLGCKKGDLPVTEKVSQTLIRLPIYPDLPDDDLDYIIDSVTDILS